MTSKDPSSYSNFDEAVILSLHLKWNVDFKQKILHGSVTLDVKRIKPDCSYLALDTQDLKIKSIKSEANGEELAFQMEESHAYLGSKLKISFPNNDSCLKICIDYETMPGATGLQWLNPEQTSGKEHPFVFSQCQSIYCRSLLPCQDSPSVKAVYSAEVTAPSELVVLMSAISEGTQVHGNTITHKFRQSVPIPAYLIALVVGAVESQDIGPRSRVWSEKEFVERAAYEFAETESMLTTAESICGEYVWGRYDLVILPPSYPYGGMENPCLTFVTPTLLAGDRSLAGVVAHEISHSWTGNLVTNCNWEHFWLNEGFTVFVENKILGRRKGEMARHFSAIQGWKDLADCINLRVPNDPLTCLIPRLNGINPDDAFSSVPYQKGHTLLWYLEVLLGGPSEFEPFLKAYLNKFKLQSINTDDFRSFLSEYFVDKKEVLESVDWQAWLHTPGMPPLKPDFDDTLACMCTVLVQKWVDWDMNTASSFTLTDLKTFSPDQVMEFLSQLLQHENPLPKGKLQKMEEMYSMLSYYNNCEIHYLWLRICIRGRWSEKVDEALTFVTEQGRMKFVHPIYKNLYDWTEMRARAVETFLANRSSMMHVSSYLVSKDLHLEVGL